jgi:hypothetical protein
MAWLVSARPAKRNAHTHVDFSLICVAVALNTLKTEHLWREGVEGAPSAPWKNTLIKWLSSLDNILYLYRRCTRSLTCDTHLNLFTRQYLSRDIE